MLRRAQDGVRLLGMGELKAKVAFSVWGASKSAVAAVEKAGGSVTILAPKKERRANRPPEPHMTAAAPAHGLRKSARTSIAKRDIRKHRVAVGHRTSAS